MFKWLRRLSTLISLLIGLAVWTIIVGGVIWGVGAWYNYRQGDQPMIWGVVWSTKQAEALGLDATEDLDELLSQIPFKRLQLTTYWPEIEPRAGVYDFETLDEQLAIARSRNVAVELQVGLHQARWPHCHEPSWAEELEATEFRLRLKEYLRVVVEHFDSVVNLVGYQLEPEIFTAAEDSCKHPLSGADLAELYRHLDDLTDKEITVSRPNNWAIFSRQDPNPNTFGLRLEAYPDGRGWFHNLRQRTPLAHYYSFSAGNLKILHSSSQIIIRDLNTEPAALDGNPTDFGEDWNLSAEIITKRLDYARRTNIKTTYLRGAEWWLSQKRAGDETIWEAITEAVATDF